MPLPGGLLSGNFQRWINEVITHITGLECNIMVEVFINVSIKWIYEYSLLNKHKEINYTQCMSGIRFKGRQIKE